MIDGDRVFCANCGEYEDAYFPEGGGWGKIEGRRFTFMNGRIICQKCWRDRNKPTDKRLPPAGGILH